MTIDVKDLDKNIKNILKNIISQHIVNKRGTLSVGSDAELCTIIGEDTVIACKDEIRNYYSDVMGDGIECRLSADDCVAIYHDKVLVY